jgi:alanine racemase
MSGQSIRLTKIFIHLDRLTHNMQLLQEHVGTRPLWPCIKANAYGHGSEIVAGHLKSLGYHTFGVADVEEGMALVDAGIQATYMVLSETLPEHSEALVRYGFEPTISTLDMAEALSREAMKLGRHISVHIKVDTGMGRVGIQPNDVKPFLDYCQSLGGLTVRGMMSHFPRADEADKSFSLDQIEHFKQVVEATKGYGIEMCHMANSAAIFDLPDSYFDAVRPGISIYGLRPSWEMANPRVHELQPILEWKTRIVFLKEVPAGRGLSYGHAFHTKRPSLIATLDLLVRGARCPQVGRITMDMTLIDVTELRGQVDLGEEVVIIGRQEAEEVTADELAGKLGTINYEIVTCISHRVPRVAVREDNLGR